MCVVTAGLSSFSTLMVPNRGMRFPLKHHTRRSLRSKQVPVEQTLGESRTTSDSKELALRKAVLKGSLAFMRPISVIEDFPVLRLGLVLDLFGGAGCHDHQSMR